jgi:hypothetical protein
VAVVEPRTQRNPRAKAYWRRRNYVPRTGPTRPHLLRLIHRNKHHLGIRRLNHHHLHVALLFYRDRLVFITVEHASGVRVLPQGLNRCHHRLLVGLKRFPQCGIVIQIRRHHVDHGGKVHQRDERRIEPLLLRCIRQLLSLQVTISSHPEIHIVNLLRIR